MKLCRAVLEKQDASEMLTPPGSEEVGEISGPTEPMVGWWPVQIALYAASRAREERSRQEVRRSLPLPREACAWQRRQTVILPWSDRGIAMHKWPLCLRASAPRGKSPVHPMAPGRSLDREPERL